MKFKILLVDKDQYLLDVHKKYFANAGYEVDCATTEPEALTLIVNNSYAAIVCDLHLDNDGSNQQGLVFASKARALRPGAVFFILTSRVSHEFERNAISQGVYKCLTKPQPLSVIKYELDFAIAYEPHGIKPGSLSHTAPGPVLAFGDPLPLDRYLYFNNLLNGFGN